MEELKNDIANDCINFQIRVYRKNELAMMYFPMASKETAIRCFRRWLVRNSCLMSDLLSIGYDKHRQHLLKPEVALIVKYLGEPY